MQANAGAASVRANTAAIPIPASLPIRFPLQSVLSAPYPWSRTVLGASLRNIKVFR